MQNTECPINRIEESGKIEPADITPIAKAIYNETVKEAEDIKKGDKPVFTIGNVLNITKRVAEAAPQRFSACFSERRVIGGYIKENEASEYIQKTADVLKKFDILNSMIYDFSEIYKYPDRRTTDDTFNISDIFIPTGNTDTLTGDDIISATISYAFDRNKLIETAGEMFDNEDDEDDEELHDISDMLARKLNIHETLVRTIQTEVMKKLSETAGDEYFSEYVRRVIEYVNEAENCDAYPGFKDNNILSELQKLPVIPLISAEDLISKTDSNGTFSQKFVLRMKLNGRNGRKISSRYYEDLFHDIDNIKNDERKRRIIKAYFMFYFIDKGKLPEIKRTEEYINDMKSYRISTNYDKLAECVKRVFKNAGSFECNKYIRINRIGWTSIVSNYDDDNKNNGICNFNNAVYVSDGPNGIPVKINFEYVGFRKAGVKDIKKNTDLYSRKDVDIIPAIMMSNIYELNKIRDEYNKHSGKRIFNEYFSKSKMISTKPLHGIDSRVPFFLYDYIYSILLTLYIDTMLYQIPESDRTRILHIFRMHSGSIQENDRIPAYLHNECREYGGEDFVRAMGYAIETVFNKNDIIASTQGLDINNKGSMEYGENNALSSLFHNLPAKIRNYDTGDVMIAYRTKSPSDNKGYNCKADISSIEMWVKHNDEFKLLGMTHDISEDPYTIREESALMELIKKGYDIGIKDLIYLCDAPFSTTTAETEDINATNMYYMEREIFEKLEDLFPEINIFPLYMSDYQIFGEFKGKAVISCMDRVYGKDISYGRVPLFALTIGQPGITGKTSFRNSTMYQSIMGYFDQKTDKNIKTLTDINNDKTKAILFALFCLHVRTNEKMGKNGLDDGRINPFNRLKNTLTRGSQIKYKDDKIVCFIPLMEKIYEMAAPAYKKE